MLKSERFNYNGQFYPTPAANLNADYSAQGYLGWLQKRRISVLTLSLHGNTIEDISVTSLFCMLSEKVCSKVSLIMELLCVGACLLSVCFPFASCLLSVCFPFAFRLLSVCLAFLHVCFLLAFCLLSDCFLIASCLLSVCFLFAFRLLSVFFLFALCWCVIVVGVVAHSVLSNQPNIHLYPGPDPELRERRGCVRPAARVRGAQVRQQVKH
jgi:hypothetical protein